MSDEIAQRVREYFTQYPRRVYPKGQVLVFADESPEHIFYIVKGKVIKYDVSYRGDEVIVNIYKPPAFFPMSWAINHSTNKYYYETDEETELHVAPPEDTVAFLRANPDVTFDLLSRLYRGMDGMLARMVQLMSGTARSRLMYELLIEARRFGKKQPDNSYRLSISEQDIAARAGLSRETVSREINKLKLSQLASLDKNAIIVENLSAIEKALGVTT